MACLRARRWTNHRDRFVKAGTDGRACAITAGIGIHVTGRRWEKSRRRLFWSGRIVDAGKGASASIGVAALIRAAKRLDSAN